MKKRKIFAACLALLILLQLFAGCNVTDQAPSGESSGDTSNSENDNTQSNGTEGNENESTPSDDADKGVALTDVTFYGYANDWVGEEFLNANRVYCAYYPNLYVEGEVYLERNEPRKRAFIVTTEEEYRNMGLASPIDVDFEKEMLILYVQPTNHAHSDEQEYYLETARLYEGTLTVKVGIDTIEQPENPEEWYYDACQPYALCVALKMEKAEITEVIFKGISMFYHLDYAIPLP